MEQNADRPLLITGAIVGLVVIAAIVVIALRPGTAELEPGSPEAVVQSYLLAVVDRDTDAARDLLAKQPDCEGPSLRPANESIRVSLEQVGIDGDRATVDVLVTLSYGSPPFDRYQYSESQRFVLRQIDGDWLITEVPWQFRVCEERLSS